MLVFETIPTGEPPLAKHVKSELEWKRSEFESTLRQWFKFMVVSGADEAAKIRDEWKSVFERLPKDEDPNNLASELKPKWGTLPTFQVESTDPDRSILDTVTCRLENPPVNPVTGPGRSGTEVQREVHAYRQYLRRVNHKADVQPIFQSDYLFVQLPGTDVFLARVVHDCCIDDALSPSLTFTIGEYIHEPQNRVPGFFGTFTKKPNAAHNPLDKRTGGKFVRHANITRDLILVIGVQVWVDRKLLAERAADEAEPQDCLRVAPESLRALALKRPAIAVPGTLPASHRDRDVADRATQAARTEQQTVDDPPPPIPTGFRKVDWNPGDDVQEFLVWTKLSGESSMKWHRARVVRKLHANFRGGYTHDARFSDGTRGVALIADTYEEGCWVSIAAATPPQAARAPAAAAAPAPAPRVPRGDAAAPAPAVAAAPAVVAQSAASNSSQGQSAHRPASSSSALAHSGKRPAPVTSHPNPTRALRSRLQ